MFKDLRYTVTALYNTVIKGAYSMPEMEPTTKQAILDAGESEFLNKGFHAASLRNIVKDAGVTTGAFYGYYKSKEELFDALFVAEPYNTLIKRFLKAQDTFATLPPEEQPANMGNISGECMDWMVDYIYEHLNAFQLLLCCAEGTRYEQFLHTLAGDRGRRHPPLFRGAAAGASSTGH